MPALPPSPPAPTTPSTTAATTPSTTVAATTPSTTVAATTPSTTAAATTPSTTAAATTPSTTAATTNLGITSSNTPKFETPALPNDGKDDHPANNRKGSTNNHQTLILGLTVPGILLIILIIYLINKRYNKKEEKPTQRKTTTVNPMKEKSWDETYATGPALPKQNGWDSGLYSTTTNHGATNTSTISTDYSDDIYEQPVPIANSAYETAIAFNPEYKESTTQKGASTYIRIGETYNNPLFEEESQDKNIKASAVKTVNQPIYDNRVKAKHKQKKREAHHNRVYLSFSGAPNLYDNTNSTVDNLYNNQDGNGNTAEGVYGQRPLFRTEKKVPEINFFKQHNPQESTTDEPNLPNATVQKR